MSVEDVQFNVQWIKGRLSFVALHGAETLASSFVDPTDEESIAKLVVDVSSANGFTDAERDRLAQDVELAIRAEAKNAPEPPPDLVPLRVNYDIPPFPLETLPPWLRAWVVEWSGRMQLAPEIGAAIVIGIFSAILQMGAYVRVGESWQREALCQWVIAMAPPSAGKSPVFKAAIRKLIEMIEQMREEWLVRNDQFQSMIRAMEARQTEAEKRFAKASNPGDQLVAESEIRDIAQEKKEIEPPRSPCWRMADATKESVRKKLDQTQGYAAILDDEPTFLNNTLGGRYSSSGADDGLDSLRNAWSGDPLPTDRSGSQFSYHGNCHLTILQVVQPQVMETMQKSQATMKRGTFARFLMLWPSFDNIGSRTFEEPEITPSVAAEFDRRVESLFRQCQERIDDHVEFQLSPGANEVRKSLRLEFERLNLGADSAIVEGASKISGGVVVRLAGLLHGLDHGLNGERVIDRETMARAAEIARVFRAHLAKTVGEMSEPATTDDAVTVLEVITDNLGVTDEVACSKVTQRMRQNRNWHPDRTKQALAALEKFEHGRVYKVGRRLMFKLTSGGV